MKRRERYCGSLLVAGLIALGFVVAIIHGGFPSILCTMFMLLPIVLLAELTDNVDEEKKGPPGEGITAARTIALALALGFVLAWFSEAIMPSILDDAQLQRPFHRVEFPFSEVSHVAAGSDGSVYVYSQLNNRVQKYGKDRRFQIGWFAGPWKHGRMAIDNNDCIYVYCEFAARKYDALGRLISEVQSEADADGWWRIEGGSAAWKRGATEPARTEYNKTIGEGDVLPGGGRQESGFSASDGKTYALGRLWFLFPVVRVYRDGGHPEGIVRANVISLPFTLVFPGFLFGAVSILAAWALERPRERLRVRTFAKAGVAVLVFVLTALVLVTGSQLIITITNSVARRNPWYGWLIPAAVIPYWLFVVAGGFRMWQAGDRWMNRFWPDGRDENDK